MNIYFGLNLKSLMKKRNIKNKDLSASLKISESQISKFFAGKEPSYEDLIKISNFFNVQIDYLLKHEPEDYQTDMEQMVINGLDKYLHLEEKPSLLEVDEKNKTIFDYIISGNHYDFACHFNKLFADSATKKSNSDLVQAKIKYESMIKNFISGKVLILLNHKNTTEAEKLITSFGDKQELTDYLLANGIRFEFLNKTGYFKPIIPNENNYKYFPKENEYNIYSVLVNEFLDTFDKKRKIFPSINTYLIRLLVINKYYDLFKYLFSAVNTDIEKENNKKYCLSSDSLEKQNSYISKYVSPFYNEVLVAKDETLFDYLITNQVFLKNSTIVHEGEYSSESISLIKPCSLPLPLLKIYLKYNKDQSLKDLFNVKNAVYTNNENDLIEYCDICKEDSVNAILNEMNLDEALCAQFAREDVIATIQSVHKNYVLQYLISNELSFEELIQKLEQESKILSIAISKWKASYSLDKLEEDFKSLNIISQFMNAYKFFEINDKELLNYICSKKCNINVFKLVVNYSDFGEWDLIAPTLRIRDTEKLEYLLNNVTLNLSNTDTNYMLINANYYR